MAAPAIVTVFSALADETRLDIVTRLADGLADAPQVPHDPVVLGDRRA